MEKVGNDGVITVEEAKGLENGRRRRRGMQFDRATSPHFINNAGKDDGARGPYIPHPRQEDLGIRRTCSRCWEQGGADRPLLIVAEDVEGEALATLVVNKHPRHPEDRAVKAPGFGDRRKAMLEDIAILTGGKVIISETSASSSKPRSPTSAGQEDPIEKENTTIIDGAGKKAIQGRVARSADRRRPATTTRKAAGASGQARRRRRGDPTVGAATEVEMKGRRTEDALHATRAAVKKASPGGGVVRCARPSGQQAEGDLRIGMCRSWCKRPQRSDPPDRRQRRFDRSVVLEDPRGEGQPEQGSTAANVT